MSVVVERADGGERYAAGGSEVAGEDVGDGLLRQESAVVEVEGSGSPDGAPAAGEGLSAAAASVGRRETMAPSTSSGRLLMRSAPPPSVRLLAAADDSMCRTSEGLCLSGRRVVA